MKLPHPLAALPLLTLTALAAPADWPQRRGVNRDQYALTAYELRNN